MRAWLIAILALAFMTVHSFAREADACVNASDVDQKIVACTRLLAARLSISDRAGALGERAGGYLIKGQYDLAIVDLDEALRINPRIGGFYNGRGLAYYNKGDYDRAISDYDEALKFNPRSDVSYQNRGNAYLSKSDYDRAIADYDESLKINPKNDVVYSNRGYANLDKDEYSQAIADYDVALKN
jgi:tetratricopeptide (TPR) repeat protein